ncbi:MAG: hypothetical protein J6N45_07805 [Alphaproteobacteria bacterium]|nr:hypothetical protein [Alphaproteobacteria bacterium]
MKNDNTYSQNENDLAKVLSENMNILEIHKEINQALAKILRDILENNIDEKSKKEYLSILNSVINNKFKLNNKN